MHRIVFAPDLTLPTALPRYLAKSSLGGLWERQKGREGKEKRGGRGKKSRGVVSRKGKGRREGRGGKGKGSAALLLETSSPDFNVISYRLRKVGPNAKLGRSRSFKVTDFGTNEKSPPY